MTDTQRHFYHMLKNLGRVRPDRESDLPINKIRRAIFRIAASHKFDNFMLLLIMVRMNKYSLLPPTWSYGNKCVASDHDIEDVMSHLRFDYLFLTLE